MATATAETRSYRQDSVASGAIYLLGSQFMMLAAGYAVHAFLGRTLSPATYGLFGVVMAFLTWVEVSLCGGFPYVIRKFGAANPSRLPGIVRTALKGQFVYAMLLLSLTLVTAPLLAAALGEPGMTGLIRIAALDIPIFAFYFSYLGILNAKRAFRMQSMAVSLYATGKVIFILTFVIVGWGVPGALVGNIVASVIGFGVAAAAVGRFGRGSNEPMRPLIGYAAGTALLGVIFTLLISIDIFCVKALMEDGNQVGYYVAAATLARAPFMLFIAISTVTLPALSNAISSNDGRLVHVYVSQSLRLHLIMLLPLTVIISASSTRLVTLVYGHGYESAGPVLSLLMAAFMLFGLTNALYHMLVAAGQTKFPLASTAVLVMVLIGLALWMIPKYGIFGGAVAATWAAALGFAGAGVAVHRRFGSTIGLRSLLRIIAVSALIYMIAYTIQLSGVYLIPFYAALGLLYLLILTGIREITLEDLSRLAPRTEGGKRRNRK